MNREGWSSAMISAEKSDMKCFNSGCSFTTPNDCISEEQMYWYFLGQYRGCTEFVNDSRNCSSNDLIFRRVYDHVLRNLEENFLYIVNITSLNRMEIEMGQTEKLQEILSKDALARYDQETMELTLYANLIGLISFLKQHKKDFYIINNSKGFIQGPWQPRDAFMEFVAAEPRILNLYEFSRADFHKKFSGIKPYDHQKYGWDGHDGPDGHYAYFLKLIDIIESRNQVLSLMPNPAK